MKIIVKKPLRFTVITTLCLVVITLFAAGGCVKTEYHTVSFTGEGIAINPQSIEHGKHATKPENPVRDGYSLDGWFADNGTFANEWDFKTDIVTQDTTLYAKWEEINLQGTKWKLIGIGSLDKIAIQELEPKDCDDCYVLSFDKEPAFSCSTEHSVSSSTYLAHSVELSFRGCYSINYTLSTLQFIWAERPDMEDIYDGELYYDLILRVRAFERKGSELKLYYNDKKNYLMYKEWK